MIMQIVQNQLQKNPKHQKSTPTYNKNDLFINLNLSLEDINFINDSIKNNDIAFTNAISTNPWR